MVVPGGYSDIRCSGHHWRSWPVGKVPRDGAILGADAAPTSGSTAPSSLARDVPHTTPGRFTVLGSVVQRCAAAQPMCDLVSIDGPASHAGRPDGQLTALPLQAHDSSLRHAPCAFCHQLSVQLCPTALADCAQCQQFATYNNLLTLWPRSFRPGGGPLRHGR